MSLWFFQLHYKYQFTFHYGSILINNLDCHTLLYLIYIPLWFYSNFFAFFCHWIIVDIYIPLWFYSNNLNQLTSFLWSEFTFHYGSILIFGWGNNGWGGFRFTFHYGSILIYKYQKKGPAAKVFTFHYGSILIKTRTWRIKSDFILKSRYGYFVLINKKRLLLIFLNLHSTMVLF